MTNPSPNGGNGHGADGRFARGNPGGPGNPYAARVAAIRTLMLDSVTDDDLKQVVAKLVEMATGGDLAAIRELFDRTLGKSVAGVEASQLQQTLAVPVLGPAEREKLIQKIMRAARDAGDIDESGDDRGCDESAA
jgi:hypothetical protein